MALEELKSLILRHSHGRELISRDGVLLSCQTSVGPPVAATSGVGFALIAQGVKRLTVGKSVIDYGAGEYLVSSLDLPVTGRYIEASWETPALGVGLILDGHQVAELLLQLDPRVDRSRLAVSAVSIARASDELLDAVVRLLRLFDRPRDRAVLAPMVRREILWLLLTGPLGPSVRQLGLADSSLSHVSHAVRSIRDRYSEPIRVEDLAHEAGMSMSAFHRNFRAVTGVSPIQFQKRLRLHEARQMLLSTRHDVAEIGVATGYSSPSQFNRDYQREFGTAPGRDRAIKLDERDGRVTSLPSSE